MICSTKHTRASLIHIIPNDKVEDPSRPWVVEKNGEYKYYGNFDWYNCLFDNTRPTWEHNLTVSGGTEKVKYMLSGNYYNQKGIIRIDSDRFKKYTFRSKIIANITSWFELSNNTSYYHSEYTYPGGMLWQVLCRCIRMEPWFTEQV